MNLVKQNCGAELIKLLPLMRASTAFLFSSLLLAIMSVINNLLISVYEPEKRGKIQIVAWQ